MSASPHDHPLEPGVSPDQTALAAGDAIAPLPRMKRGYISLLVIASCALYVAWIAPVGFSLAVRIGQIDPAGKNALLAFAIGIPGVAVLLTGPLVGVLSDRTRLRLGRRRTWLVAGTVAGFIGSVVVGLSTTVGLLIAAWTIAYIGYTAVGAMLLTHLGDRLPEEQRGRVAGFTGAATQLAPVIGVVIAGMFTSTPALMFIIPAAIALAGGVGFAVVMKDEPATERTPVDLKTLAEGFWFDPRRHPDFGWVWLSRMLIFLALSFMSIYTVYLLATRLGLPSATIAGLVAATGVGGILLGIVGALVGGFLSDRLRRRKPFLVAASILLATGLVITGSLTSIPQYFLGALVGVLGTGVYGAVDQAIMLDVLPKQEGQNGRYLAIFNLANQFAQAVGPFLAALIVGIAGGQYGWVYFTAAALALCGGLSILPVRVSHAKRAAEAAA